MKEEELLQILLYLIDSNFDISRIASILNLSYEEIYRYLNLLKQNGYDVISKYYANGNTSYSLSRQLFDDYTKRIITEKDSEKIDLVVYSDLHFGSFDETPEYLEKVYQYSKEKDFHLHLNLGDLIEGDVNNFNQNIPWQKQVEYMLKSYPHQDDILVFLLLGNHDYSLLNKHGLNICEVIKNKRGDIIPLGYGKAHLEIKNDYLVLEHPLLVQEFSVKHPENNMVILRGHSHEFKVTMDTNNLIIYVPTLSNLNFKGIKMPSFLHLRLLLHKGLIEYVYVENIKIIDNTFYHDGKFSFCVGRGKSFRKINEIRNEEEMPKILVKK